MINSKGQVQILLWQDMDLIDDDDAYEDGAWEDYTDEEIEELSKEIARKGGLHVISHV